MRIFGKRCPLLLMCLVTVVVVGIFMVLHMHFPISVSTRFFFKVTGPAKQQHSEWGACHVYPCKLYDRFNLDVQNPTTNRPNHGVYDLVTINSGYVQIKLWLKGTFPNSNWVQWFFWLLVSRLAKSEWLSDVKKTENESKSCKHTSPFGWTRVSGADWVLQVKMSFQKKPAKKPNEEKEKVHFLFSMARRVQFGS